MRLSHLDQIVELERGEAGLLARALAVLVSDVTHARRPVTTDQALRVGPLAALGRQLVSQHRREQDAPLRPGRRPRPRRFRVRIEQLVALLDCRAQLGYCGLSEPEGLQLRVVVGKFHQVSLNLEHWISFP